MVVLSETDPFSGVLVSGFHTLTGFHTARTYSCGPVWITALLVLFSVMFQLKLGAAQIFGLVLRCQ